MGPVLWLLACVLVACTRAEPAQRAASPAPVTSSSIARDVTLAAPALCDRPGADRVRDLFCRDTPAAIHDLAGLENGLGLTFSTRVDAGAGYYVPAPNSAYLVLLAHSTALSGALVSPINPRAIIIDETTALAFTRGVQQVELAAHDRDSGRINLYLLRFEQACTAAADGCGPIDRYTERLESNWTRVGLEDADDLANTPDDCRQCHQRGVDHALLLMRELNGPWTHFLGIDNEGIADAPPEPTAGDLTRDFEAAHAGEPFAAVDPEIVRSSQAFTLRHFVDDVQPLLFNGLAIEKERWPKLNGGYASEPQRSATWDAAYAAFQRGEQLSLPYYAPRASDPDKQQRLTAAYQRYRAGAASLPDLADIFPDDPRQRAEIGLQVDPSATPAEMLVQACGPCHNDVLDQSLSRARFSIALGRLDRAERETAVARLAAVRGSAGAMPPRNARQLDADAIGRLTEYLEQDTREADDDAFLDHAAQLGMAVKAN
jgi:hypothetical protein